MTSSVFAVLRLMINSTFGGLLHRQIGRLLALENATGVDARLGASHRSGSLRNSSDRQPLRTRKWDRSREWRERAAARRSVRTGCQVRSTPTSSAPAGVHDELARPRSISRFGAGLRTRSSPRGCVPPAWVSPDRRLSIRIVRVHENAPLPRPSVPARAAAPAALASTKRSRSNSGHIAARSVETVDEARCDGIDTDTNTIGIVGRSTLPRAMPGPRTKTITANLTGERDRPPSPAVGHIPPHVFDCHIAALDEAGFAQALAKRADIWALAGSHVLSNPITGIAGCCARAASGHAAAAPPNSVMNSRRFNCRCLPCFQQKG